MRKGFDENTPRVALIVRQPGRAFNLLATLARQGMAATLQSDPIEALRECRLNPPHLVIVEDDLGSMSGVRFLSELLKLSWTTSTILIANESEEAVHERTEGLGILGRIRDYDDTATLHSLIEKFFSLTSQPFSKRDDTK